MAKNEKLKVVILVDNRRLNKWEEDSLSGISDLVEIVMVLSCKNSVTKKHAFIHGAYYVLNILSIKSSLTRKHSVNFGSYPVFDFESNHEGEWQWIPDHVVRVVIESGANVMLKFGMSLLKQDNLAEVDVLSFHHGDPRHYRGRPTGFYELIQDAKSVGFIVQKITNVLDGGEVLALGSAKIYRHSYRKTIQGLYRSSPPLLRRAIINYLSGMSVPIKPTGNNYRLPGNGMVAYFCARLLVRKMKHLAYGMLWEKRWNVAVFENFDLKRTASIAVYDSTHAKIPAKYTFYADPFFSLSGACIRVEAVVGSTGRGEIVELDSITLEVERTLLTGPHFSYPYTLTEKGREFMVPEVADHEAPYLLDMSSKSREIPLLGLEHLRLVDASIVKIEGRYYLFGGYPDSATGMLQLYVAESIGGPYKPHRMNPIVMDPSCARMGGRLLVHDNRLYRFGQNNSDAYGDGIYIMEVIRCDPDVYEERKVGELRFSDASGPHTVDIQNGRAVFDFYMDKFSVLAGYRRFATKIYRLFYKKIS